MHVFSIRLVCTCTVGVGLVVRRWLFQLVHCAPCDVDYGVHGCSRTIVVRVWFDLGQWFMVEVRTVAQD